MKDEDLEIGMKAKAKLMESIMGQFSFARGSEELSEDIQTPEREREGKKEKRRAYNAVMKTDKAYFKKRGEIMARPGSLDTRGYATDAARRKADRTPEARADREARKNLGKVFKTHEREAEDQKNLYGKGGKVIAKRKWIPVKEDIQTPERRAEMRKKIKDSTQKEMDARTKKLDALVAYQKKSAHAVPELFQVVQKADDAVDKAWNATRRLTYKDEIEREDKEKLYGKGGKVVAKRSKEWIPVKSKKGKAEIDESLLQTLAPFAGTAVGLGLGAMGVYRAAKKTPLTGPGSGVLNYVKNFGKGMLMIPDKPEEPKYKRLKELDKIKKIKK